jgi:hypothetical protein
MQHLSSKTVKELKEYAKENGVSLESAKTKAQILSVLSESENLSKVVKADEPVKRTPVSSSGSSDANVVISKPADNHLKKTKRVVGEEIVEKVAVHSEKNMRWQGVGKISAGYNIVTEEEANKWTTLKGIRMATPEEIASYYGKV